MSLTWRCQSQRKSRYFAQTHFTVRKGRLIACLSCRDTTSWEEPFHEWQRYGHSVTTFLHQGMNVPLGSPLINKIIRRVLETAV